MDPRRRSPHRRPAPPPGPVRAAFAAAFAATTFALAAAADHPTAQAQPTGWWDQPSVCAERVSQTDDERSPNADSGTLAMSDDGRYVAFASAASDIVAGDDNANADIFVRDRAGGTTVRVAAAPDAPADGTFGAIDAALSGDASTVAFSARTARAAAGQPWQCALPGASQRACVLARKLDGPDAIVLDRALAAPRGDGVSRWPALSRDGSLAAFWSSSANLAPGDVNGAVDVFVTDLAGGTVERISRGAAGEANGPSGAFGESGRESIALSRDGRFVAFGSRATNLVTGTADGEPHVYVFDRTLGTTTRVDAGTTDEGPIAASFLASRQAVSDDGRLIVFGARIGPIAAGGRERVVLHDRVAMRWTVLRGDPAGAGTADGPAAVLSGNGRYVAFAADDARAAQVGLFVHDRTMGRTFRAGVGLAGRPLNGPVGRMNGDGLAITADGRQVAWRTTATNVVTDDLAAHADVFVSWPCDRTDDVEPTATPGRTASPSPRPTATSTPMPSPTAPPVPTARVGCICAEARRLLPPAVLDAAIASPERVFGWRLGLNVGRRVGPSNPPRECLSVRRPNGPYHPLWNGPMYVVGCRQAGRP